MNLWPSLFTLAVMMLSHDVVAHAAMPLSSYVYQIPGSYARSVRILTYWLGKNFSEYDFKILEQVANIFTVRACT